MRECVQERDVHVHAGEEERAEAETAMIPGNSHVEVCLVAKAHGTIVIMTVSSGDGGADERGLPQTRSLRRESWSREVVVCKARHETLEEQLSVRGWLYKHCWGKLTGP